LSPGLHHSLAQQTEVRAPVDLEALVADRFARRRRAQHVGEEDGDDGHVFSLAPRSAPQPSGAVVYAWLRVDGPAAEAARSGGWQVEAEERPVGFVAHLKDFALGVGVAHHVAARERHADLELDQE